MRVNRLSRAEQQMVEIAKAFRTNLSILILDEPTAALTDRETDRLFQLVEDSKRQGVGIIYITHRMNELHRIGDRVTVLRDGGRVDTLAVRDATPGTLVHDVSLTVRAGEIVGLAGLVGSGKSEVGRACFGLEPIRGGTVRLLGRSVGKPTPGAMLRAGLAYVPPDRRTEGLVMERSVRENIALSALPSAHFSGRFLLRRRSERA